MTASARGFAVGNHPRRSLDPPSTSLRPLGRPDVEGEGCRRDPKGRGTLSHSNDREPTHVCSLSIAPQHPAYVTLKVIPLPAPSRDSALTAPVGLQLELTRVLKPDAIGATVRDAAGEGRVVCRNNQTRRHTPF